MKPVIKAVAKLSKDGRKDEDDAKRKALEDAQEKGTMVLMC